MTGYDCCSCLAEAGRKDLERVFNALEGKMVCGETDGCFEYCDAPKIACDNFILSAFRNVLYELMEVTARLKATEEAFEITKGIDREKALLILDRTEGLYNKMRNEFSGDPVCDTEETLYLFPDMAV